MSTKSIKLPNTPPKGTADWWGDEFIIRKYIFDTWRKVCTRYGYNEYLTPILETADIYRAKSGEDIGGKELMTLTDQAGRELSIRPEMTPSVTRMVTRFYDTETKPIRLFSIANFFRNEKPQKGRNREFWQLNFDVFGSESIIADTEIAQIALDIILEFGPPKDSFIFYINNRKLINALLDGVGENGKIKTEIIRTLDKWDKLSREEFIKKLKKLNLEQNCISRLIDFMESKSTNELIKKLPKLQNNEGLLEIQKVMGSLENLGYADWIQFNPSMIRGFDYYDGMIYEVFDRHPDNNRSMFGGGRYNGLASIFGSKSFPAVGFAPGDETTKIFLESWNLVNKILENKKDKYYLPILSERITIETQNLAQKLRSKNLNLELGLTTQKLGKALDYANKKNINKVIILGEEESEQRIYKIKDMRSGEEGKVKL